MKVAILVKQVPVVAELELLPNGRLRRDGPCEMDPLSARAVAQGVLLARQLGASSEVITLGPPSAIGVLRQAILCGADKGTLVSDTQFRGSDTLATAQILKDALVARGPFDFVLAGDRSIDGETGLVPRQIAALLGYNFAGNVVSILGPIDSSCLHLKSLSDDTTITYKVETPMVFTCAERLCKPCKAAVGFWDTSNDHLISTIDANDLGYNLLNVPTTKTDVVAVKQFRLSRIPRLFTTEDEGIEAAIDCIYRSIQSDSPSTSQSQGSISEENYLRSVPDVPSAEPSVLEVISITEGRDHLTDTHTFATASNLASQITASLTVFHAGSKDVIEVPKQTTKAYKISEHSSALAAKEIADTIKNYARAAVLVADSSWGKEICAYLSVALSAGAVGGVAEINVTGDIVGVKPNIDGTTLCDIAVSTSIKLFTVTPGVQDTCETTTINLLDITGRDRLGGVEILEREAKGNIVPLSRSKRVVAIGDGVLYDDLHIVEQLADLLSADIACTRRVADKGWFPRSRQVGITGTTISPDLYIAIGISGKLNHMIGALASKVVLAINSDPSALIFDHCDVGIVLPYQVALRKLIDRLAIKSTIHEDTNTQIHLS